MKLCDLYVFDFDNRSSLRDSAPAFTCLVSWQGAPVSHQSLRITSILSIQLRTIQCHSPESPELPSALGRSRSQNRDYFINQSHIPSRNKVKMSTPHNHIWGPAHCEVYWARGHPGKLPYKSIWCTSHREHCTGLEHCSASQAVECILSQDW